MSSLKKIALTKLILEALIIILIIALIVSIIGVVVSDSDNKAPVIAGAWLGVTVILVLFVIANFSLGIVQIVLGVKYKDTLSIVSGALSSAGMLFTVGFTLIASIVIDIIILCSKKTFNFDNTHTGANRSIDGNPFNSNNPNLGRANVDNPFNTNPNAQPKSNPDNPYMNPQNNQDMNNQNSNMNKGKMDKNQNNSRNPFNKDSK